MIKKKGVTFQIHLKEDTDLVFVAGTFNMWNPFKHKLTKKDGIYSILISLPQGIIQYKFVVKGTWIPDPCCDSWVVNGYGSLNSVLMVEV